MAPKAKGESKRGLVVALVFFVLATIGLGLSTYYGFAEQEKKDKAVATAIEQRKLSDSERDFYRFMVALLMAYVDKAPDPNSPIGRELTAANKAGFDAGTYPPTAVAGIEGVKLDLPAFKAVIAKLTGRSPWEPAKGNPRENYDALVKVRDDRITDLEGQLRRAKDLAEEEKQKSAAAIKARDQYRIDKDASIETFKKEFEKERNNFTQRINDLAGLLKKVEDKKFDEVIKPLEAERNAALDRAKKSEQDLKEANSKLIALQAKVDVRTADRQGDPTPRGKIQRVHVNPRKATIDLGRRDGLTPQTTFAVHGLQPNGKPKLRPKGNIEVLTVGETTSEVLVTAIFHPDPDFDDIRTGERKKIDVFSKDNTDPIIAGDVIINPLWNPNAKTHIAIAGILDVPGFGAVNMTTLTRLLDQMNVIVDGYVDTTDGSVRGAGPTRRTDYILMGAKVSIPGKEDDDRVKKINKAIDEMLRYARENGIRVMQPKRFFEETGFNIPRNIVSE